MAIETGADYLLTGDFEPSMIWLLSSILITATLLPASFFYLRRDYLDFLSLGPGGTPQTIPGYLRIKALGCFALRDRYLPPHLPPSEDGQGYLTSLPARNRPRPNTKGIAPHRQVTQAAPFSGYETLAVAISRLADDNNDRLTIGISCFEKHNTALFSTAPTRRTCKGEVCHAHPSDGSLHLTLGLADAKLVLEKGWGEWHPLACGVLREKFVPWSFMLIYAPLNENEVAVVMRIVKAAAWYVGGGDEIARVDEGAAAVVE